jgi:putative oxidoreductase
MRIVLAFLYLCHGVNWIYVISNGGVPLMSRFGAAGIIETVAGTLMLVGLWTSPAAFVASGEMAVAYFITHAKGGLLPLQNKGEITVALCFAFLYMATVGDGPISLRALFRKGAAGKDSTSQRR